MPWCEVATIDGQGRTRYTVQTLYTKVFQDLPRSRATGHCQPHDPGGSGQPDGRNGEGVIVSLEGAEVWVYNQGQEHVYVHSPTLEFPQPDASLVDEIRPDQSMLVFDYSQKRLRDNVQKFHASTIKGLYDKFAIQMSLSKGWGHSRLGKSYRRQAVNQCPHWLEVYLQKDLNT